MAVSLFADRPSWTLRQRLAGRLSTHYNLRSRGLERVAVGVGTFLQQRRTGATAHCVPIHPPDSKWLGRHRFASARRPLLLRGLQPGRGGILRSDIGTARLAEDLDDLLFVVPKEDPQDKPAMGKTLLDPRFRPSAEAMKQEGAYPATRCARRCGSSDMSHTAARCQALVPGSTS